MGIVLVLVVLCLAYVVSLAEINRGHRRRRCP